MDLVRLNDGVRFFGLWLSQSLGFLFLSSIFSKSIVLGNANMSRPSAAILAGLVLTISYLLAPIFVRLAKYEVDNEKIWSGIFFVINLILIWILKRLADITGLGISNLFFVFLAAIFTTLLYFVANRASKVYLKS